MSQRFKVTHSRYTSVSVTTESTMLIHLCVLRFSFLLIEVSLLLSFELYLILFPVNSCYDIFCDTSEYFKRVAWFIIASIF